MGCGETTALRMMLTATRFTQGPESVGIVAATGCNTVYGSTWPYNPFGVPWTSSLFENAASVALGVREPWGDLAVRYHNFTADYEVFLGENLLPEREVLVDGTSVRYGDQILWASLASLTGQPATALPIGLNERSLPIGVQAIGPFLEDRTTIEFAHLAEQTFGGFKAPPEL